MYIYFLYHCIPWGSPSTISPMNHHLDLFSSYNLLIVSKMIIEGIHKTKCLESQWNNEHFPCLCIQELSRMTKGGIGKMVRGPQTLGSLRGEVPAFNNNSLSEWKQQREETPGQIILCDICLVFVLRSMPPLLKLSYTSVKRSQTVLAGY